MGQTGDSDELFEIASDELRAVVGDDSRFGAGIFFQAALEDDLDVGLGHGLAQFPVNDCARAAVEQRAQIEESPGDVDLGDVDVPVFVRTERLHKAAFKRGFGFQESSSPAPLSTR